LQTVYETKYMEDVTDQYSEEPLIEEEIPQVKPIHRFIFRTFIVVVLFSFLTAYLTQHIYVMNISYQMQENVKNLRILQKENELLQIKLAKYESMEWIDKVAQQRLGMIRPEKIEYLIVKDKNGY